MDNQANAFTNPGTIPKQGSLNAASANKNLAINAPQPGSYRTADFTVNMSSQQEPMQ